MKRNLYYVALCLFALFTFVLPAEAGGGYTVRLTASANPNTGGTVYVVKYGEGGNDVSKAAASYQCEVASSKSAYEVFVVYANPKRGKKFNGWTDLTGTWTTGTQGFISYSARTGTYTGGTFVKQENGAWVTDADGASKNPAYIRLQSSTANDYAGLGGTANVAMYTRETVNARFTDNEITPWDVQYLSPEHGTYTVKGPDGPPAYGTVTLGGAAMPTYNEDQIELHATPENGYAFTRYIGEDAEGNVITLGEVALKDQTISIPVGIVKVSAEFTQQPFLIGERTFANLDAALQAVETTTSKTILLLQDGYTVPAGNYTIPSGVTLLIPKSDLHVAPETAIKQVISSNNPTKFRKLILGNNVNITVNGTIEVGGTQGAGAQGATGAAIPTATYGQLHMTKDSKITLNNGAKLRAWGFVTGETNADGEYLCEIDARRGSTVYEQFQNYDWKGGTNMLTGGIVGNDEKVFPVNTYFIQNVEAPVTYHPGSALHTVTSVNVDNRIVAANVQIVGVDGDIAMFLMDNADTSEDTWVRKSYDAKHDLQVYEINSSARLGSIILPFGSVSYTVTVPIFGERELSTDVTLRSSDYDLPLTSNLKIHLLTGEMKITQNTVMLPGAEIEIDKTATVIINPSQKLYLYDSDQWGNFVFQDRPATQIRYAASHGGAPNKRTLTAVGLGDAKINVHGTFDVQGSIYTTAGGANVYSSIADAGTVQLSVNAPSSSTNVYQWINTEVNSSHFVPAACTSAWLKNDVGSTYSDGDGFTETAGTDAGQSFCFLDINKNDGGKGEWVSLTTDGCFVYDGEGTYYAKPADYVALANGKTENADHTYSSADGTRLFILIGDCQWWEVVYDATSGLYKCNKNGIYYYYDDSNPNPDAHEWKEKMCTITWQDWNGEILKDEHNKNITYLVPYGSTPKFNNSTPTRPDDVGYYTYDFTGWAPAFASVTADVTYVAQYERNPVMYTITWQNANGTEREVDYFQRDEMPVCRTQPADMSALEWRPAVAAVTGNATYRLSPKDNDGPFTIKFVNWNWDGTDDHALKIQSVAKNDLPVAPANPTKPALDDVEFIFAGWSPEVVAATAAATYTATFTEQPITYTILWKNYDGATLETDENVAPNAVPQYNGATPTKPSDDEYHYQFAGWNTTPEAATEDAEYTATYNAIPKDKIVTGDNKTFNMEPSTQITVTNFIVKDDGKATIPSTSRIDADNFIIEATATTSGQLLVSTGMSVNATNYYFDFYANAINHLWYAVAVPWQVDAQTGISVNGRTLTLGKDFDIIYYNGELRASVGKQKCWSYVEDDEDKTLQPGRLYMIGLMMDAPVIRFTKKNGATLLTTTTSVTAHPQTTGDDQDANWNGVANPALFHAYVNAGTTAGQVYISAEKRYEAFPMNSDKLVVGQGAFVQAPNDKSIVVNTSNTYPASAPRRAKAEANTLLYDVRIAHAGAKYTDRLFVTVDEEKEEDKYIIGKDLAKVGVSKQVAQMWISRYNTELCMNTMAPVNGVAEYPLGIFAPKAGEYVISCQQSVASDQTVYLTLNGEAIWNLSDAAYTGTFDAGTTSAYGLRISARAPQITTGIDEAVVDAKGETRKVLIDNQVFIIRGEKVYSVDGQLVK